MGELHLIGQRGRPGAGAGPDRALNVLIVHDSEREAARLIDSLRDHGLGCVWRWAQTAGEIARLLGRERFDVVLAAFELRALDAMEALRAVRALDRTAPVIVVSGPAGEEPAVAALQAGASDYVGQGNLARLGLAVRRALTEAGAARRYLLLSDIAGKLLGAPDPATVVAELCDRVATELGCPLFLCYLVDEQSGRLHLQASGGLDRTVANGIEWLERDETTICGRVAVEGRPIVAEHVEREPGASTGLVRSFGIRAYAVHPLLAGDRVIGTLSFGAAARGTFAADEIELMRTVAEHVAVALDRQRLIAEAERRAREAEQGASTLRAVLEHVPEGITIADAPDVTIRAVSAYGRTLTERPREEIEGIPVGDHAEHWGVLRLDGAPADDDELPLTRATRRGEVIIGEEWLLARPSGERVRISCNAGPIRDAEGRITGGVIAWRDVTAERAADAERAALLAEVRGQAAELAETNERLEARVAERTAALEAEVADRERAETAALESEARFRAVFERAPIGIALTDDRNRFQAVNTWFADTLGYREEQLLGTTPGELTHPDDRPADRALLARLLAGQIPSFTIEKRYLHRDGHAVWVRASSSLVRSGSTYRISVIEDVTARKTAEQALAAAEERLRLATEATALGAFDYRPQTGELIWTAEAKRHFGLSPGAEVDYATFLRGLHPDDRERVHSIVQGVLSGGSGAEYDIEYRTIGIEDGVERWLSARGRVTFDAAGRPLRFIGSTVDISERKRAEGERERLLGELARRAAEAEQGRMLLDALMDNINEGIVITGGPPDFPIARVSRHGLEMTGRDPAELTGMASGSHQRAWRLTLPDGVTVPAADQMPLYRATRLGETVAGVELLLHGRDGRTVPVMINAAPIRDASGAVVAGVNAWRDITELKRGERERESLLEQVRAERRTLEAVLEQMPAGVSIAEAPSGKLLFHNRRAVELIRHPMLPVGDVGGYRDYGALHAGGTPYDPAEYPIARAVRGETVLLQPMRYRRGDGTLTDFVVSAAPVRNAAGSIVAAVSTFEDVSERLRIEEALRTSELRLAQAGEMTQLGAWETTILDPADESARSLVWSDQVFRIFGYEPGAVEVSEELFFSHVHPDDRGQVRAALAAAMAERRPYGVEHRILRTDGSERVVAEHAEVEFDEDGVARRLIGAVQDITDRKRAEEALRESHERLEERVRERTAELEQAHRRLRELSRRLVEVQEEERRMVARELHDEAGQVLTALKINLLLLEREAGDRAAMDSRIASLRELTGEAMERIHEVGQRLRPAVLDRAGLVPALRELMAVASRAGLVADLEAVGFEDGRLPFELETTVYRVVQESVTNVLRHAGATHLAVVLDRSERAVVVVIEDDGGGFDVEAAANGGSHGLEGMRQRAELGGGRLAVESEAGAGTTIRLELPIRPDRSRPGA